MMSRTAIALATTILAVRAHAQPPITAVAFAPDGQTVVAGSQAGIQLYAWPDLTPGETIETTLDAIHDLQFSPDGGMLAVAGGTPAEDGSVALFAWPERQRTTRLRLHGDTVRALAWHPDGTTLATASDDRRLAVVRIRDCHTNYLLGHSKGVTAIGFIDATHLISGGRDASLRVWHVPRQTLIRTLDNHRGAVHALAVHTPRAGLPVVASAGADRTVRLWQPTIGRLVRFAKLPVAALAITISQDGDRLVAACRDGRLRVIDSRTVAIVQDQAAINGWAYSIALARSERFAVVGGSARQLERLSLTQSSEP